MHAPLPQTTTVVAIRVLAPALGLVLAAALLLTPTAFARGSGGVAPPTAFVPNAGQTDPLVRFQVHAGGGALFFTPQEVVLAQAAVDERAEAQTVVGLRFDGANPNPDLRAMDRLPGVVNYFLGSDPARWRANVPTYGAVVYRELYSAIDVRYDGRAGFGAVGLNGTFTVGPSADPSRIRWRYDGAASVSDDPATGGLRIVVDGRALAEGAPIAWQEKNGTRVQVAVQYRVAADGTVGFKLGRYDPREPLVIAPSYGRQEASLAPALGYSTYLGGTKWDEAFDIEVDRLGRAHVTGFTVSAEFPTAKARQRSFRGGVDAFVTKLSANGRTLLYSTYLGGRSVDVANGIALDRLGNAYVAGRTESGDFPTASALQRRLRGRACQAVVPCHDAFVTKLSRGGTLRYSTYLGGRANDEGLGIAVDRAGNAWVTGTTESTDFPSRNGFQRSFRSRCEGDMPCPSDAFVAKLGPRGRALRYGTYLGGSKSDRSAGIAVDRAGNAYVAGTTRSPNFPTKNARQRRLRGRECGPPAVACPDVFVTKVGASGGALRYSTYLGGRKTETAGGIAVDGVGNAYLTGGTQSSDFPTARAVQPMADNSSCSPVSPPKELCNDVFVTKLGRGGRALRYSTYLSGNGEEQGLGIAVSRTGSAYVTGSTDSHNFRTVNAIQPTLAGAIDTFVARLRTDGSALIYSTYLGGSENERGNGIAVDRAGNAYVTGRTNSSNFPVANALQPALGGDIDAFVAKLR